MAIDETTLRERALRVLRGSFGRQWGPELEVVQFQMRDLDPEERDLDPEEWVAACKAKQPEGTYSVVLSRLSRHEDALINPNDPHARGLLRLAVSVYSGVVPNVAEEILKRVEHVAPQPIAEGVSLDESIRIKEDFERRGAPVARANPGRGSSSPPQVHAPWSWRNRRQRRLRQRLGMVGRVP